MNKIITSFKIRAAWLFSAMLFSFTVHGQWQSTNPGAGGQVQDIVCDPNTPNRVFLASDMEGIYESTDNGQSWHETGHLKQNRVYAVAVTPGNSNKMYVGTLYGLEVSNDSGGHFDLVTMSKRMSIGAIAVSPSNPNLVIAGVGWRDDGDFAQNFGMSKNGQIVTYRSTNGGSSWSQVNIGGSGDRNVYTIQFDKNNANIAYMGTSQGVFKTTNGGASWFALGGNPGTNTGVALSPNGQTLYGTFNHNLYTTSTSSINWQQKMSGLPAGKKYWYPEVDPRDNGNAHHVILAILGDRPGFFEGTFNTSGGNVTSYSWKEIWNGISGYDHGWDQATPNPRVAHYTPASWSRAIWSTSNQTIFQATPGGGTWGWNWNNKYCIPNPNITVGNTNTYFGRGTASTYTYDLAIQGNYVIQSMADNGWVESWDGGQSWSNMQMRWKGQQSDAQSVDIGFDNGKFIAITESSPSCYGGACFGGGRLWTKILNTSSPSDEWIEVNGSRKGPNGTFNGGQYRDIAVSPVKRDRVFACSNDFGLYMTDDLWATANGAANMQLIGMNNMRTKKIAPHPTNADIVFLTSNSGGDQGVFKGVKNGSNWSFTKILSGGGWDAEVDVWEHNGQVYVFYFGNIGNEYKGMLSLNEGSSWTEVMTSTRARQLNTPSWYNQVSEDFRFQSKGGIAGYDNKIILNYYDHRQQQTYGVYRGTINGNQVTWEDWTGDIHFGGFTSARIATGTDGKRYFWGSTAGAGAVRRELDGGTTPTAPNAPSGLSASSSSSSQINLVWNDNSNNESGFKVERKQGSGSYSEITSLPANTTSYADTGLTNSTTYTYRVKAFNSVGNSGNSNESSATTGAPGSCNPPNLISNGEFESNTNGWIFYNDTGAGASGSVSSASGGMSGANAAKITISNGGSADSHVQFYSNVALQSGITYEVIYQAKATSARSMRVQLLQEGTWANYGQHTVNLGTSVSTHVLEVTMSSTDNNARLDFFVGNSSVDVFIDAVVVREKCEGGPDPVPPVVSITSPSNGANFTEGNTITINASASDSDGTVTKVEFFAGSTKLGEDTNSPYSFSWNGASIGNHTLTARATDNDGLSTTSGGISVTVNEASNLPPTVSISSPANGSTFTEGSNITINASAADSDGNVTKVEFYRDGTKIGEDTTNPYSLTWSNAAVGTYSLTAKATDNDGAQTTSTAVSVTVEEENSSCTNPNLVSNGEFESNTNGWTFYNNTNAGASGSAANASGGMSGSNAALITISNGGGSDTDIQFFTNVSLQSGKTYEVIYQAKATSNRSIRVQLLQEGTWANYGQHTVNLSTSPSSHTLEVTMNSTDNNARLDFFVGNSSADVFIDAVVVREKCEGGPDPVPPVVSITSPSNGANFTEGNTITINASASDSDGTVTKVEFFAGSTKLGEDTNSPYSFSWNGASIGNHTLTARATDNDGLSTTSGGISVTVNEASNVPPTVSISSPANGSTFTEGSNITINASAADSDGNVTKVEFYRDGTKIGEDTTNPYSLTWSNVAVGTYSLTAKATDNDGAQTTSTAVSVTVEEENSSCTNPNLVSNGEFESNTNGWTFYNNTNAGASGSAANASGGMSGSNAALITISNGGGSDTDIQFFTNVSLQSGKTYEVIYQAKATSNRSIRVQLLQEGTWANYGQHTVNLSTSPSSHTLEVTMNSTDNNARLDFFLGNSSANVYLDAVMVREKCPTNPGGCTASGTILYERYNGISGTTISALKNAGSYPGSPSSSSNLSSFEAPNNVGDNYGIRISGYICAPETGSYTFWIAGDDNVELALSTDASSANKTVIASHNSWTSNKQWNKFSSQKSASIQLTQGQSYYVEALMKEGGGGDNLAVGWRKPSDGSGSSPAEVIPGSVLSPSAGGNNARVNTQTSALHDVPQVTLYPNPVKQGSTLRIRTGELVQFTISVMNLNGQIVYRQRFEDQTEGHVDLHTGELGDSGMLLFRIEGLDKIWHLKALVR